MVVASDYNVLGQKMLN